MVDMAPGAQDDGVAGDTGLEDTGLEDTELLAEIELLGELVIVASQHDGPLAPDVLDAVLGVRGAGGGATPDRPSA